MGNYFPNGLGGSTGAVLVTCKPLQTSGDVWWCDSTNGSDSNDGRDREKPKLTIGAAVTSASAQDIIVLKDGFAETVTSVINLKAGLTVVGEGSSGGKPTCKLTPNAASVHIFDTNGVAPGIKLKNLYFVTAATANSQSTVHINSAGATIEDCYFECGVYDDLASLELEDGCGTSPDYCLVKNCTFFSVATSATLQPQTGMLVTSACDYLTLDGVTFSDGTYGFEDNYAFNADATVTGIYGENISLLLGADMDLTDCTGVMNVSTSTGGGRVKW